jgi:gluconate 2-dehydrogenase gamma chain
MNTDLNRRDFLLRSCSGLTAVWVSAHWPALLSAATHARNATQSAAPAKLEFFTSDEAKEVDAITARIIPTDETPGAREAGVVYFIDRALKTFASEDQKSYREGLPEFAVRTHKMFPAFDRFSAASPAQQDEIVHSFDPKSAEGQRLYDAPDTQSFFETLRAHTIIAFLLDPDAGGDVNGVGWKVIGRTREHMFQPPFGYYDKNYPGWRPASAADKVKS